MNDRIRMTERCVLPGLTAVERRGAHEGEEGKRKCNRAERARRRRQVGHEDNEANSGDRDVRTLWYLSFLRVAFPSFPVSSCERDTRRSPRREQAGRDRGGDFHPTLLHVLNQSTRIIGEIADFSRATSCRLTITEKLIIPR